MRMFTLKKLNLVALCAVLLLVAACKSPEEKAQDFIQSGHDFYAEGNYLKSVLEYKNALQIDDKLVEGWYGIAMAEKERENWQQVMGALRKTLDLQPDHFEAAVLLGRLFLLAERVDLAIEYSNTAMKLRENDVRALSLQAAVLFKLGNPEGAYDLARQALELDPAHMDALIVVAAERLSSGFGTEAVEYLEKGIQAGGNTIALQLIKIQALSQMKELNEAEIIMKQLISGDPSNIVLRRGLVGFYLDNEKFDDAERELRQIAQDLNNDIEANMHLVQFISGAKGEEAAEKELERLISQNADNFSYKMALYELKYAANKVDETISLLKSLSDQETDANNKQDAILRLAEIYVATGNQQEALQIAEDILLVDQRNVRALAIRGAVRIEENRYDEAIADLRAILVDEPESIKALILLGNAFEETNSFELADERYGQAFRASDQATQIGLVYARFLIGRGFENRAEDILVRVIQNNPVTEKVVYELLAQIRMNTGNWLGAQEVVDLLNKNFSDDTTVRQLQGRIFAGQNKIDQSIEVLKSVHRDTPLAAQPMISLVQTYLQAGQTQQAAQFIESVLEANDDNFFAHLIKARMAAIDGDQVSAETSFKRAIEIDPNNVLGYSNLALFYSRADNFNAAVQTLEQGISQNQENILLRLMRANTFEANGNVEEAISQYEEILNMNPNADIATNNLVNLLINNSQDQRVIERAYTMAKKFDTSEVPHFKDTLGLVYLKKGDAEKAIRNFKAAVRISPDQDLFKFHLGKGYVSLGENETALTLLSEVMQNVENGTSTVERENVQELLNSIETAPVN